MRTQREDLMTKQVLVIEDEPNIAEAISFILSREGWKVSIHTSGTTAVQAVHDISPDVLILDVMLPGKSGYDILLDLRSSDATRALPVLMLTARGQKTDRELAQRLGVNRFMTKPFSNTEMLSNLRELIGG